jgi:hypothetical protein
MVCLLLLLNPIGIFGFVRIKNKKVANTSLTCLGRFTAFWHRVQLASMVVTLIPPHHLICPGILFLSGLHVYGDSARFSLKCFFFSFFSFFSLLLLWIAC